MGNRRTRFAQATPTSTPPFSRHALVGALLLGCSTAFLATASAVAAEATSQTNAQALHFDIPAQSLDDALAAYGIASGVQVLYGASLTTGLQSSAVNALLTREQALSRLLGGTGLSYQFTGERSVTLQAPAARKTQAMEFAPIMVTGEKINRTLEQTQSSVVVNTAETLRAHSDRDLGDVFARTPGVYTQAGNETWGIRGVPVSGFDDQGPATLNGAVSVYVDGAQQPNRALTLSPLPMWDVEQVEVFLGPQSTTQGRNSLAGAVVVQTRAPSFEPSLALQSNVGNYGERGAAVAAGGGLVDNVIAGRIAVDYQEGDGYIDNIARDQDANPRHASNVRGKLLVLPNDDLDVLLTYAHSDTRQGDNSILRDSGRVRYYKISSDTAAFDKLQQDTLSAKLDYRLDDSWSLTNLTTYTRSDYDARLDFDQTADDNEEILRTQDTRMFSQELRLAYQGDTVRGFAGAYYGRTRNNLHDRLNFDDVLFGTVKGDTRLTNQALFGELNWTFVPQWTLVTGLRYDRERNETDITEDDFSGPAQTSKTFHAVLPKLGLNYELASNQFLGFMVQKGYRGGGVNVRAGSSHAAYDPEYTTNYELSYRGAWLDDSLRARANLFYTDWKDQQVSVRDRNTNFIQVYNAASSQIKGLELFLERDINSHLELTAGLAYTDGRYKKFEQGNNTLKNEPFLYAPRYKASVGALYRFDNGLRLGSDVVYQEGTPSQYQFDANGKSHMRKSDSYVLVNFNAEYELLDGLVVSGYVKNLFDKQYVTNNRDDDIIDVGAPRTLGVVLNYRL
ncbi:TonB-dependent receptor domain-containing protein [Pseudomonas sp. Marseille-Q8238]